MKKLTLGILVLLMSFTMSLSSVYAGSGGGRSTVPEPVRCLLFLAGGITLAAVRRLRSKRRIPKVLEGHSQDIKNAGLQR